MVKKGGVPNAWDDDDWETQADKAEANPALLPTEPAKLSKAERLAKHAEENKQLWDSAETPNQPLHYLATHDKIPLKTPFKPALKVLSRKPAPKIIAKQDPITGLLKQMTIEDEEDEEDEGGKKRLTPEELRAKAQREREEKQRKYDEARAKIFGTGLVSSSGGGGGGLSLGSGSGSSTPGNVTPPTLDMGRGGKGSRGRGGMNPSSSSNSNSTREKGGGPASAIENRRPGSSSSGQQRELFDPNYTPKPSAGGGNGGIHQRGNSSSGRSTPREKEESMILRQPRAPDSSGRGGFGFGGRGHK